ncbi:MAG: cyclic lactone autoinducer peptide [Candidatus Odinarchaeota archaeon]
MIDFLLLDLPDNLAIFLFLLFSVNFYILNDMRVLKVFKLIIVGIFIYLINIISKNIIHDDIIILALNPLPISVLWVSLFEKISFKRFFHVYLGTFAFYLFKGLIQIYIPIIKIIFDINAKQYGAMLTDINKAFLFVLPARIIEFVSIYLIYKYQKKTWSISKMASRSISFVAEHSSNTATLWFIYQPKEPKSIKKVN